MHKHITNSAIQIAMMILLSSVTCLAQAECKRYVESAAGFSICVPDGWTIEKKEGREFKVLFSAPGKNSRPNINFEFEPKTDNMSLDDFVSGSVKYTLDNFKKGTGATIKVSARDSFTTEAKVPGVRVTFLAEVNGILARTRQYYFDHRAGKLMITGGGLEEDGATTDSVFDRAVETLLLTK